MYEFTQSIPFVRLYWSELTASVALQMLKSEQERLSTKQELTANDLESAVSAWSESALMGDSREMRCSDWEKAVGYANERRKLHDDVEGLIILADVIFEAARDRLKSSIELDTRLKRMALACVDQLQSKLNNESNANNRALLLSRQSRLLRSRFYTGTHNDGFDQRIERAVRVADLALQLSRDTTIVVEAAACHAQYMATRRSEVAYSRHYRIARDLYEDDAVKRTAWFELSASRFYRYSWNQVRCIERFPTLDLREEARPVLRESNLLAEASIQLFYSDLSHDFRLSVARRSKKLLDESIEAGYSSARSLLNSAFLAALVDGEVDEHVLGNDIDLNELVRKIEDPGASPLLRGLSLGIESPETWNRIGTYAKDILNKPNLARSYYSIAASSGGGAVAHTNLARLLIEDFGDDESLREARGHLGQAKAKSDPSFRFWEQVQDEWMQAVKKRHPSGEFIVREKLYRATQLVGRCGRMQRLKEQLLLLKSEVENAATSKTRRSQLGMESEVFLEEVFEAFNFVVYRSAKRRPGRDASVATKAPDLTVRAAGTSYIVESKARERSQANAKDIDVLNSRVALAHGHAVGLFFSLCGFDRGGYEHARKCNIVTLSGDEVLFCLNGSESLESLLSIKLLKILTEESHVAI